jgi:uncharacterized membrane protein YfcA
MVHFIGLVCLGFAIGVLSGLFGVGGGFLLVPMLNILFNIPYNIAVGSSLCQMVGTSIAASLKHRSHGNIDIRLALFVLVGSAGGAEIGARILMRFKAAGVVTIHGVSVTRMYLWIDVIYICLLTLVGAVMFIESRKARRRPPRGGVVGTGASRWVQSISIPPVISLPVSRIEHISVWVILVLGFCVGTLSGLLGVGGGFVMTPIMIYLIEIPTHVAIGTELFQIIFTAAYGGATHFFKENVDFIVVGCILAGSLVGSLIGATINKKVSGENIRYYFSWIVAISIVVLVIKFLFVIGLL